MICLFASTARDLYLQEVLDILALPYQAAYHFQYDEQYVVKELIQRDGRTDGQSLEQYEGKEALILLVDQSAQDIHFYPLRKACIKKLEWDGCILHVYFTLGDYVDWNASIAKEYDGCVSGGLDEDKRPRRKYISVNRNLLAKYIAFAKREDAPRAWQTIVDVIHKEVFDYKNTIFYRIIGVRKVTESVYLDIQPVISHGTGYILESGQMYGLDLSFYHSDKVEKPLEGSKIVPLVDKDYFAFLPSEIMIIFRYDKRLVELVTKPVNQDSFTRITFSLQIANQQRDSIQAKPIQQESDRHHNPTGPNVLPDPPVRAPQISLLLKLTYPRLKFGIAFILLFISQLMIAVPSLASSLTSQALSDSKGLIFILWLFGSFLYAGALFVLFKNLPGVSSSTTAPLKR